MDKPAVLRRACCTPPRPTTRSTAPCCRRTREQRTVINKHLIFFDLEWVKVADEPARRLIAAPGAGPLSPLPGAEAGLAAALPERAGGENPRREERSPAGPPSSACSTKPWRRMQFPFEHGGQAPNMLTMQQINAKLYDADRGVRQAAADGLTQGLQGKRPAADVSLQQPGPRSPDRLRAAPLRPTRWRRATWPTRSRRASSRP